MQQGYASFTRHVGGSLRIDRNSVRGAVAGYAIIIADWTCRPFRAHQTIGGDQIIVEAVPKLSMRLEPVLQHLFARPLERACRDVAAVGDIRSEEHTSELQSLMRISYAVFCLKKNNKTHR